MKKNWTMRVALLVVALTLITSCFVGGTFAKYVTGASYEDTARVAKFGVVIEAEGEGLFAKEYAKDDTTYTGDLTVQAEEEVVAPGTNNADSPITFSITGTPEVAVRVTIEFGKDFKDVVLPKGTYRDYTVSDPKATFTLTEDYYPIVYTLKEGNTEIVSGTLEKVKDAVAEFATGKDYAPGTVFNTEFTLTWAWAFEVVDDEGVVDHIIDAADTYLGNVAAGIVPAPAEPAEPVTEAPEGGNAAADDGISTTINFDVTFTVTQID
jgi:hypothetical protein